MGFGVQGLGPKNVCAQHQEHFVEFRVQWAARAPHLQRRDSRTKDPPKSVMASFGQTIYGQPTWPIQLWPIYFWPSCLAIQFGPIHFGQSDPGVDDPRGTLDFHQSGNWPKVEIGRSRIGQIELTCTQLHTSAFGLPVFFFLEGKPLKTRTS